MPIIVSEVELEFRLYHNQKVTDLSGNLCEGVSFLVVRETTREEYLEQAKEIPNFKPVKPLDGDIYYEILID